MSSAGADPTEKCPVDHETRERWLEAARAKGQTTTQQPNQTTLKTSPTLDCLRYSLDAGRWTSYDEFSPTPTASAAKKPKLYSLDTSREISTIPRALPTSHARQLNAAEQAALPANSERDTGHDQETGNWIYPSQEMFFNAMKRKGHDASPSDMTSIVPIHNAVNERAWKEIKAWERGRGAEACGGPRLVSFAGDSKALTPRARWNVLVGYQPPFDRHDWVIDRCGKEVDYVIDFYSGKDEGLAGKSLNFYLDVRPKLNSWEGIRTRIMRAFGV